jgi:SulP family sulfate permease
MKRMSDIAENRIQNVIDSDVIDDYSHLPKGIAIYEISGPLFFGSARTYANVIEDIGSKNKILIIRMRHVSFVDQTGLHNLKGVIKSLKSFGVRVIFSGVNPEVCKDFEKYKITEIVKKENIFDNFDKAVVYAKKIL